MNPKSLEALLMDRSFGELSPEACELLDAYLESNPDLQKLASQTEEAMAVTGMAVNQHPELFAARELSEPPTVKTDDNVVAFPGATWLKAAAAIALLCAVGAGGYFAGNQADSSNVPVANSANQPATPLLSSSSPGPWAQYRIASGGIETSIPTPTPKPQQ